MKVWRIGFMRWRRRDGPWGSHQLLARALKWETSVGSTEEVEEWRRETWWNWGGSMDLREYIEGGRARRE
jgi:hypothetical protein